ncbi:MAG: hypothetical protein ABIH50_06665 [bacterium]
MASPINDLSAQRPADSDQYVDKKMTNDMRDSLTSRIVADLDVGHGGISLGDYRIAAKRVDLDLSVGGGGDPETPAPEDRASPTNDYDTRPDGSDNPSVYESATAIVSETTERNKDIMDAIKEQIGQDTNGDGVSDWDGGSVNINIGGKPIDVASALGSLVLDDSLQKGSTLTQIAAQAVANENQKASKTQQTLA